MATIVRIPLIQQAIDAGFWQGIAQAARDWARQADLPLRDVLMLVPYGQLLAPARAAFAVHEGWSPRIETTHSLARALEPPLPAAAGQLRMDVASDRLTASALLREQAWGHRWLRADPIGFEQATAAVVETAHALAQAAAAIAPGRRDRWIESRRAMLQPVEGPGRMERALARIAFEWAAAGVQPASDVLFSLHPAGWIVVQAGGDDDLVTELIQAQAGPVLWIDTDPPDGAPFDAAASLPAPSMVTCDGFESEAQACAAEVLHALSDGTTPVAIVAQDRVLVRRVRALLERSGVPVRDETGWKLSTTRAAARVMALLRAAPAQAGPDARLDWMKAESAAPAVQALEARWRRGRAPEGLAAAHWAAALERLAPWTQEPQRTLRAWLRLLRTSIDVPSLTADAAGRQLLSTLHLDDAADEGWQALAEGTVLDLAAFTAWVAGALEDATFLPPSAQVDVVITPLARTLLRPFGAVVFPGTDERRLGGAGAPMPLLGDALAKELGLVHAARRREREAIAFAHVLRLPALVLLRRRSDGVETLGPSPLVERADAARRRLGASPLVERAPRRRTRRVPATPVDRPAPVAQALPASLSASAIESLRDCPYRFHALVQLGLAEAPELEGALEKRDYGTWLHAVLHRFHRERPQPRPAPADVRELLAAADRTSDEMAFDPAELLPFRVSLEGLAPQYVAWLQARDAQGWQWAGGEEDRRRVPAELGGTGLHGRIDRIDRQGAAVQLIDYKTGSYSALKKKLQTPLEDTQLPVYAALGAEAEAAPVRAMYLVLDERRGAQPLPHENVQDTAQALLEGLGADLALIREGAGLAALGEGRVCDYCQARGLCRRDHWQ